MNAKCIICNKNLSKNNCKYCRKHYYEYNKGNKHPNWKGGKPKCNLCGKILSHYKSKRCKKCVNK